MAKKKSKAVKKRQKMTVKKKSKGKKRGHGRLFSSLAFIMAVIFFPTTLVLSFGLLPTPAAGLISRDKKKSRVITVGAMNMAGCMPFLLDLWKNGNSLSYALEILSTPSSIIVMYAAAGVGYLIDWAMTGLVAVMLFERGKARKKEILKQQKELIERWGKGVTGELALDAEGFPVETLNKEG